MTFIHHLFINHGPVLQLNASVSFRASKEFLTLRFRNTAKMAILKMKLCIFADELASLIPYHHK